MPVRVMPDLPVEFACDQHACFIKTAIHPSSYTPTGPTIRVCPLPNGIAHLRLQNYDDKPYYTAARTMQQDNEPPFQPNRIGSFTSSNSPHPLSKNTAPTRNIGAGPPHQNVNDPQIIPVYLSNPPTSLESQQSAPVPRIPVQSPPHHR